MRSRERDEDAELLLDWKEMVCSLVETSSEEIDWEYAGLMTWEGQAVAFLQAETYSFLLLFVDVKE